MDHNMFLPINYRKFSYGYDFVLLSLYYTCFMKLNYVNIPVLSAGIRGVISSELAISVVKHSDIAIQ